jgi:steroid delta-isomerase-like uncharacterized protein
MQLLLAILLIGGVCNAQAPNNSTKSTKNKEVIMSTSQRNKEVIQKVYEALNKRNMAALDEFVSEDYVGLNDVKGAAGFRGPLTPLIKSVPDIQWTLDELVGDGDKVAVKWKITGTYTTPYQNFAATGKPVVNEGMAVFELKDGKITGNKVLTDRLGFLQEMEVLPKNLAALAPKKAGRINFIDKFLVPANGKQEFMERLKINRDFLKKLPGFIEDAAYERTDENGNLVFITIAVWENEDAIKKAKEAVQAEYKKQGFNMPAMLERLNITMDRGLYKEPAH